MSAFQVLKGALTEEDENINRDIGENTLTGEWKRTSGQSSDTSGTYQGNQDAIDAAAGALGLF